MDTRFLQSLIAVAKFSNLTSASRVINLAPTAVSRQIKLLEEHFGEPLFERSSRGMQLTPAGQMVRDRGVNLLQELDRIREDVAAMSGMITGVVNIGAIPSCETTILPKVISSFMASYPDVQIRVTIAPCKSLQQDLRLGLIDMALLYDIPSTSPGLEVLEIRREPLLLVACASQGLRMDNPISLEELSTRDLVLTSDAFGLRSKLELVSSEKYKKAIAQQIVVEANTIALLTSILPGTELMTVLPEVAVRDLLERKVLSATKFIDAPELDRTIVLCKEADRTTGHSSKLFEEELLRQFIA